MSFCSNGIVSICGVDFWQWVSETTYDYDQTYAPTLDFQDGTLILTTESGNTVEIDGVAFWEFVLKYSPIPSISHYLMGKPTFESNEVHVRFVAATSDPINYPSLKPALERIHQSWQD